MKKRFLMVLVVLTLVFLSYGCQNSKSNEEVEIKAPKVNIIGAEHVGVDEEVQLVAMVYFGEELVDDAEVVFEFKYKDHSEKVEAKQVDKGSYEVTYHFKEEGLYKVIAHTNVRDYHVMPSIDIHAGGRTNSNVQELHEGDNADKSEDHLHHHDGVH